MSAPEPAAGGAGQAVDRLVEIIAALRARCPWMGELTHASLVQYLVEETYELVDALEALDALGGAGGAEPPERPESGQVPSEARSDLRSDLRSELGDVLLQVVLHAQLQQEQGSFGLREVAEGLSAKMIRRNPHVFNPDGSLRRISGASAAEIAGVWQDVKRRERPGRSSPFDGIPRHLPALASAAQSVNRAGDLPGNPDKGTVGNLDKGTDGGAADAAPLNEEALGEALFALARDGVRRGLDPERALRAAVRRYQLSHLPAAGER